MKEYREAMGLLTPTEEQKDRMFSDALSMAERRAIRTEKRSSRRIMKIACGAAAAAAVICTTTVFADEIKTAFYSFFGNDAVISDSIIEDVYSDTDGHVDFSVEKVVSDRINSYAIVRYTALDDSGNEWLSDMFEKVPWVGEDGEPYTYADGTPVMHYKYQLDLTIQPNGYDDHNVSFSYGLTDDSEITDDIEDSARVFRIKCEAADEVFNTDDIRLSYPMPGGGTKTVNINVSESIELLDIKLDSSKAAENYYIPTGVKLSSLGIMVYGNNNGLYDYNKNEMGFSVWMIPENPETPTVTVVMKDGSEMIMYRGWSLGSVIEEEKDYEVQIFTEPFESPIDTENVAGIILDGVYYEF